MLKAFHQIRFENPRVYDSPYKLESSKKQLDKLQTLRDEFLAQDGSELDLDPRPNAVRIAAVRRGEATGTLTPEGEFSVALRPPRGGRTSYLATNFQAPNEGYIQASSNGTGYNVSRFEIEAETLTKSYGSAGNDWFKNSSEAFYPRGHHEVIRSELLHFEKDYPTKPSDEWAQEVIPAHQARLAKLEGLRDHFLSLDGSEQDLDPRPGGVKLEGSVKSARAGGISGTLTPSGEFVVAEGSGEGSDINYYALDMSEDNPAIVSYEEPQFTQAYVYAERNQLTSEGILLSSSTDPNPVWKSLQHADFCPPKPEEPVMFRTRRS